MSKMILIKGDWVITQNKKRQIIKNGAVVFKGDQIIDVGKQEKIERKYKKEIKKIIGGKNKVIIPGLINCHTHAAMTLLRGYADDLPLKDWLTKKIWPKEAKFKPNDIFRGTRLACQEMREGGTTVFNDMYYFPDQAIKATNESNIRGFISLIAIDLVLPNFGPSYIEKTLEKLKSKISDQIRLIITPHAIYTVSRETLIWCKKFADKNKLGLHIHLSETEKEVKDCLKKHKCRPVEYLEKIGFLGKNVIIAHGCWLNDKEIKILAKRKVSVAHCPTSNLKLASGIMPLLKLLKAEVNVCLGTDSASSNNSLDMFGEMKMAALIHKWNENNPQVADAQTILDLATINGAKALGIEKELGSLEIGKKADLIILNFDQPHLKPCFNPVSHLVYACRGSDVETTIVNGTITYPML